jgi:hypothetical protein
MEEIMKKAAMVLVLLGVMIFGLVGSASAGEKAAWVNVPFAFYAGNLLLPAGDYLVNMQPGPITGGNVLKIANRDGSICQQLISNRVAGIGYGTDFNLYFNRYGDSYFLSKVKGHEFGAELAKSSTEKKAETQYLQASASASAHPKAASTRKAK